MNQMSAVSDESEICICEGDEGKLQFCVDKGDCEKFRKEGGSVKKVVAVSQGKLVDLCTMPYAELQKELSKIYVG